MNFTFNSKELFMVLPMILLFVTSLIPLMFKVFNGNKEPKPVITIFLTLVGITLALITTIIVGGLAGKGIEIFSRSLIIDGIAIWTMSILLVILAVILVMTKEHALNESNQFSEYIFLLFNSVIGMMVVVMANDLILMFIGIEMMSLCLYMLIMISRETSLSKESAIKYFILGSFASAILLYGMSFVYGATGSTLLPDIAEKAATLASSNRLFLVGIGMMFVGLGFKVSIFPFHSWTPDVYQGASTPLTGFMATAVKAVTFVAFLRIIILGFMDGIYSEGLINTLQWLAVFTMFAGNVAALFQSNFKRMLAYSSVAHSGYLLMGLIAASMPNGKSLGAVGVIFYLFAYSIMTIGSFAVLAMFERKENVSIRLDHLKGLSRKHPYLALGLTIIMLSLAGIPPTVGFFGKFFLFSSALNVGLFWLAFWGVINSVISVFYYLRPIVLMYMHDSDKEIEFSDAFYTRFAVTICVLLVLIFGIFSEPVYQLVTRSISFI